MKNETARREIESLDFYLQNNTDDYSEESHTAMMMAVKALDQEPCDDAISRQAVLDCLTATNLKKFDFILDARDKIKNLSSVKPQEPTEWQQDHEILKAYSDGANEMLDKIRSEVEDINPWAIRYAPLEDGDTRPKIVTNVKEHVLEIIDKYREG